MTDFISRIYKSILLYKAIIYCSVCILVPNKAIEIASAQENKLDNVPNREKNNNIDSETSPSDSTNISQPQPEAPVMIEDNLPVTSVNQLADVQPTDWAFQALQSLVERYGCIAGYPDQTFRGNRSLNRYEFAAAFASCLERVNQMIQTARENYATQEELAVIRKLQTEFSQELAEVTPRLQPLGDRLSKLEKIPSFSTTTQLLGKAIFGLSGFGGNDVDGNVVFSHRTELNLDSSFIGKDRLRIRLLARNSTRFNRVTDTDMANLSFAGDSRNNWEISQLSYQFRPTRKLQVFVSTEGGSLTAFTSSFNSPVGNSGIGHIANFSEKSAIYDLGGGTGVGMEYRFSDQVRLAVGYMAGGQPNNPKQGIGGGKYGAIAQLSWLPTDKFSLGLTYIRAYNTLDTGKGSDFANDPFDGDPTTANAYGIQASYRLNRKTTLSGWVGLIDAKAESGENQGDRAKISTWAMTFGLNDIGGQGNLLGFVVGQPPKVVETDLDERKDPDTTWHLEAFYRYRINDNMYITPGVYLIINPEHNANNDPIYVWTIRQTFLF